MDERIDIGDYVRVVNFLKDNKMPVGKVESIDGSYHYVHAPVKNDKEDTPCIFECYPNEMIKLSEKEYFKLLLTGANENL